MNGIEKIIGKIEGDAKSEISSIRNQTKSECDRIAEDSDKRAQELYWKLFKDGTNDAAKQLERLGSVAQLESKKQLLAAKQKMIALTFERAVEMMRSLPEDQYVLVLAKLASESSVTGNEKLIFSPDEKEKIGRKVCAKANELLKNAGKSASLSVAPETRGIRGGLILSRGEIEVNCSLDALAESCRHELTGELAQILFD